LFSYREDRHRGLGGCLCSGGEIETGGNRHKQRFPIRKSTGEGEYGQHRRSVEDPRAFGGGANKKAHKCCDEEVHDWYIWGTKGSPPPAFPPGLADRCGCGHVVAVASVGDDPSIGGVRVDGRGRGASAASRSPKAAASRSPEAASGAGAARADDGLLIMVEGKLQRRSRWVVLRPPWPRRRQPEEKRGPHAVILVKNQQPPFPTHPSRTRPPNDR